MNVAKLRKLKKWILAEPRRYNQRYWLFGKDTDVVMAQRPPCGTAGCLAGNACLMEGYVPESKTGRIDNVNILNDDKVFNVSVKAMEILGLDKFEAENLFSGSTMGWSDKASDIYRKAITPLGRARAAAMELDRLIKLNSPKKAIKTKRR